MNNQDCEVLFRVNKQSINIADSVHVDKDDLDDDAHLRHARDETENAEFLTGLMATRWIRTWSMFPSSHGEQQQQHSIAAHSRNTATSHNNRQCKEEKEGKEKRGRKVERR